MKNQKKEIKRRHHLGVDDIHYPELRFGVLVSLEVVKLMREGLKPQFRNIKER